MLMRRLLIIVTGLLMGTAMASAQKMSKEEVAQVITYVKKQPAWTWEIYAVNDSEADRVINKLSGLSGRSAKLCREEVEERHEKNAPVVRLYNSIKGRKGSAKHQQRVAALFGEDEKTQQMLARILSEEDTYPRYISMLRAMEEREAAYEASVPVPQGDVVNLNVETHGSMYPYQHLWRLKVEGDSVVLRVNREVSLEEQMVCRMNGQEVPTDVLTLSREGKGGEVMRTVADIFRQSHLYSIHGQYMPYPHDITDGSSWNLEAQFADGTRLRGYGYMAYPEGSGMGDVERYIRKTVTEGLSEKTNP